MINEDHDLSVLRKLSTQSRFALKLFAAAVGLAAIASPNAAGAADKVDSYVSPPSESTLIELGIGKSRVVTLPRDAKEVFVADGGIAKAIVRSLRKAYLVGAAQGQTDVKFIDADGVEIASYDVAVSRDVGAIESSISRSIDSERLKIEGVGDGIVVSGSVKSAQEAQTAVDIAAGYMSDPKKVVNALKIEGQDQVVLRVKVVELRRDILKQLGVDYAANGATIAGIPVAGVTSFPFAATGKVPSNLLQPILNGSNGTYTGSALAAGNKAGTFGAQLQAMEQIGVSRTLAEPSLTAISGESAKFLAGGEFPVITGVDRDTFAATVQFKPFGVSLNFTPIVLTGGRISLKVSTEVSEIDRTNAVTVSGTSVPGLAVRRADSTVELPSGGSIVMAGLLRDDTRRAVAGLPGLMRLPVLGSLFRSNDFQKNTTELAIFVTPYIAKSTSPQKLTTPIDGFAEPTDQSTLLLGRLNRLYGVPGQTDPRSVGRRGGGFIID